MNGARSTRLAGRGTFFHMPGMSQLGLRISAVFRRTAPDPFVVAILLTALTAAIALVWGDYGTEKTGFSVRAAALLDAWRGEAGLWKLLAFSMQMCLILVTGHALAVTRPVRRRSTKVLSAMVIGKKISRR